MNIHDEKRSDHQTREENEPAQPDDIGKDSDTNEEGNNG